MSLHHAAKHLAAQGRGPDTTLVHMSKDEVKGLNNLAMAHGGHLTINPTTGLPEAGFLSSLLPMVGGAALTAISGGAINPMTAGLLVGGLTGVASGNIKKGLMAGLGAYGGAGLGSALATSGMQEAASAQMAQAPMSHTPLPPSIVGDAGTSSFGAQGFGNQALQNPAFAQAQTSFQAGDTMSNLGTMGKGIQSLGSEAGRSAFMDNIGGKMGLAKYGLAAAAPAISEAMEPKQQTPTPVDSDPGQQYDYVANPTNPTPYADPYGREQKYFSPQYVKRGPRFAGGGPIEAMSSANAVGQNTGYPMADINKPVYASPWQTPVSNNVIHGVSDTGVNPMTGEMTNFADGGLSDAQYNLGGYSDGGRLLRGPGDGVSDSIPAVIGKKQPARLADGEFVVPARIVSELGNGSTEAGARKLYAMMDRIQKARGKTVGKGKVAKNSRSEKYLPA